MLANITDVMESELQCSICAELFVTVSFLIKFYRLNVLMILKYFSGNNSKLYSYFL